MKTTATWSADGMEYEVRGPMGGVVFRAWCRRDVLEPGTWDVRAGTVFDVIHAADEEEARALFREFVERNEKLALGERTR